MNTANSSNTNEVAYDQIVLEALLGFVTRNPPPARKAYKLWRDNPAHPSLFFKRVKAGQPVYSVRIGLGYKALGLLKADTVTWFWISTHDEYDHLLKRAKQIRRQVAAQQALVADTLRSLCLLRVRLNRKPLCGYITLNSDMADGDR